jgi:hypothetical protein
LLLQARAPERPSTGGFFVSFFSRRLRVALLAACVLVPTFLIAAGPASAATVPLGGRSFDAACNAAAAGDTVTVPAGSYGSQTITCTKAVTFLGQGNPTVAYVSFSNANGPVVDGMTLTGGFESKSSKNISVRNSTLYNLSYIEGTTDLVMDHNVHTNAPGGTSWSNGDMVDIYEQTGRPTNARITISNSVLHGLRAPNASAHSDAIQLCNCSASGDAIHPTEIKILNNEFYDNECMNIRTNANDGLLFEGNVVGDTVTGVSGCGAYSTDVLAANATVRYNTFTGKQKIQVDTSADYGQSQTWIGNAGVGMSSACGAIRGTYANNVWTGQKCGATDKQVSSLMLNADGVPQAGSPLIDAGTTATYPATDANGARRYNGAAPDAGAFETGTGTVTPPPPAADTTPPATTITSAPANSTSTSASVAFTASESGSTFQCKLDAGAYAACASPKAYSGLATGSHTVSVRATDAAGNTDATPATATWTIMTQRTSVGLVAAYGFSDTTGTTVKDISGHNLTGVRSGATSTTAGKFGRGLSFDGVNDSVSIPDSTLLDLTKGMTLEAWVLPSTTSGWRAAIAKEKTGGTVYGLFGSSDTGKPSASVFTTSALRTSGPTALSTTAWSHLAVTYNGTTLIVYVNGVAVASRAVTGSLQASSGVLRLGGASTVGQWFKGKMDEVRIYDKANSAAQIKSDMLISNG